MKNVASASLIKEQASSRDQGMRLSQELKRNFNKNMVNTNTNIYSSASEEMLSKDRGAGDSKFREQSSATSVAAPGSRN